MVQAFDCGSLAYLYVSIVLLIQLMHLDNEFVGNRFMFGTDLTNLLQMRVFLGGKLSVKTLNLRLQITNDLLICFVHT